MRISDILTENNIPKWDAIEVIPEFRALRDTKQSEKWHKEGDVWTHTHLVTDYMLDLMSGVPPFETEENREAFKHYGIDRRALVAAALCHDLGKATTTRWDEESKDWKTENHGKEGERITRRLFFDETDIMLREKVCWLVRKHMVLHHIFDSEKKVDKAMRNLYFGQGNLLELCCLNYADSMGSVNDESILGDDSVNKRIARVLSLDSTYREISHDELNRQFYGTDTKASSEIRPVVCMMVGIAGSGKSTYIKNHFTSDEYKVVSRDIIREELGFTKQGEKAKLGKSEEDKVSNEFMRQAIESLSNGKNIVIDNLNLSKKYRDAYHMDFAKFNPKYNYVYIEAPTIQTNIKRRNGQIPESEIYRMLNSMDFPEAHEWNSFVMVKQLDNCTSF